MINPLRGMKDLTFDESEKFTHIVKTAISVAKRYGYSYIQTPILEETALFQRSVGNSSDIVNKEMYQFIDKGNNDICMRPEGTAGIVRAFISAKLDRQPNKQKFYYYGSMFRYERPQKGRFREFRQFGCESFGETNIYEDFTIINMLTQIFNELGINHSIIINSLGCPKCMPDYKQKLVNYLEKIKSKLCNDCNRRIETNPIRVLDCKNETCQLLLENAPKLIDDLCVECSTDFNSLANLLDSSSIKYKIDTHLVRGLDYYNKTTFEFISSDIGSQSAIAGGGRYDKLVEFLDGRPTPAIGFALGIDRIMDIVSLPESQKDGYYIGAMTPEAQERVVKLGNYIRRKHKVTIEYNPKGFKSHMKGVDRAHAKYAILIGEDEVSDNTVWKKDVISKEEQTIPLEEFKELF